MKLRLWFPLLVLLAGAAGFWWYGQSAKTQQPPQRQTPVRTALVEQARAEPRLQLSGKLAAHRSVVIAPEVTGRILSIMVRSGQTVAEGSELVRFDADKERAERAELAANLANEQRKLRDMQKLALRGAVTASDREGQEATVAMAKARLEAADYALSQRTLRAPFAGTVGLIDASAGALVSSGTSLFTLDDLRHLRLDLAVPERYLALLQNGMDIEASSTAWPGEHFHGVVSALDSRVSDSTQNIKARVTVDNADGRLRPGMLLDVSLALPAREVTLIPTQAVEYAGKARYVYLLGNEGRVKRIEVELGEQHGEQVWVLSGLRRGDRIVVEGLVNLRDGAQVRDLAEVKG